MSSTSVVQSSTSIKELIEKKKINKTGLVEVMGWASKSTIFNKLNNVHLFTFPEIIKMSHFLGVPYLEMCDLLRRELESKLLDKSI